MLRANATKQATQKSGTNTQINHDQNETANGEKEKSCVYCKYG